MGLIFNIYSKLYDRLAPEPYPSIIYDTMIDFVKHWDHGGLYIAKIDIDDEAILNKYLSLVTCKAKKKNEKILKYRGFHINQIPYEELDDHSVIGDGAIIVNRKGVLIDDHRLGRFSFTELVCEEAATGAGHTGMATLSLWPRISTYVCSHEKKMVTKFVKGQIEKRWTPEGEYLAPNIACPRTPVHAQV